MPPGSGGALERAEEANQLSLLVPLYAEGFLEHHAGRVISDPGVAIVELVANCWDAGADEVRVQWPGERGGQVSVSDNGCGMTRDEFQRRWLTLNYNRQKEQGENVVFPDGSRKRRRTAFGHNGIGRHAMFCFADEYHVETRKGGALTHWYVRRSSGQTPFEIQLKSRSRSSDHGTRVWATVERYRMTDEELRDLIGSRFVADPDFKIYVNEIQVTLTDIEHLCARLELSIEGLGRILVRRFDCETPGRTSKHNGVAWWVNGRLVGEPSWEVLGGQPLLDARTATARRYTYVVDAGMLASAVKPDWTGFHSGAMVERVRQGVHAFIREDISTLTKDWRRERKRVALEQNRPLLRKLPPVSREQVATFAEQVQIACPNITERDLVNAVQVFTAMERARSGYGLLEKLAALRSDDLDGLNAILDDWSVKDIKQVLGELRYRLELIQQLERLIQSERADELHELQPLFERGLWIFGPQFESIEFISNRTLATVVQQFFGGATLTTPDKRPDFVVLPDCSIGVYASDAYDANHEVCGVAHVVILELKRGGSTITFNEKLQAHQYARQLRLSGKVNRETRIECFVLGSAVAPNDEEPLREGDNTTVLPRAYSAVLRQAHARTFNLLRKLEGFKKIDEPDPDLEQVLQQEGELFEVDEVASPRARQ